MPTEQPSRSAVDHHDKAYAWAERRRIERHATTGAMQIVEIREKVIEIPEAVSDEADLDEVFATERHLLYVACTRARDELFVSAVDPGSEFLADLGRMISAPGHAFHQAPLESLPLPPGGSATETGNE